MADRSQLRPVQRAHRHLGATAPDRHRQHQSGVAVERQGRGRPPTGRRLLRALEHQVQRRRATPAVRSPRCGRARSRGPARHGWWPDRTGSGPGCRRPWRRGGGAVASEVMVPGIQALRPLRSKKNRRYVVKYLTVRTVVTHEPIFGRPTPASRTLPAPPSSRATSPSSAAPATSPSASCCPPSTSATATASCPRASGSSASRAPRSTTTATAPWSRRPSPSTSPPTS